MYNLPDFLETDLKVLKRSKGGFHKFHKLIHFNLNILKYLTIILYHSSKLSEYKTNKIDTILYNKFSIPTEGTWLSFLEAILSGKFIGIENPKFIMNNSLSSEKSRNFNQVYSLYVTHTLEYDDKLIIYDYFKKIVSIKNKFVSHSLASEDKANQFFSVILPLTEEVLEQLSVLINTAIYYITEDDSENELFVESINSESEELEDDILDAFSEDGLYLKFGNTLINTSPFLICRDGSIFIYNRYDVKNKKIYYIGQNYKELYIRSSLEDISEVFNIDKDSLYLKSIPVQIKVSKNNIYHNLPNTDYQEFIGRKSEFEKLTKMLLHKRHFICALDGIGGVGKSAIALELCNSIFNLPKDHELYFEYIIWLSAKTTVLRNGEIYYIDQAFEHLEQLLDTILEVLGFSEYKILECNNKENVVFSLLETTKALIVLDNLETIKKGNLSSIWEFINELPPPSKVLLTSREFHYDVSQTLRIENLSQEDSELFIKQYCKEIGLPNNKIDNIIHQIIDLACGLPIALRSIIGQIYLGKNFRSIKADIDKNTDNLSKFCFKEQLKLLKEDHIKVLLIICLSSENLDYDALCYMAEPIISEDLMQIIKQLSSLSIIKVDHSKDYEVYTILPLIKNYILSTNTNEEIITLIKEKLSEYYQLKDVDTYTLLPIEERSIDKGSLIPRKIVDKAMKHANQGEVEEAENNFKMAIKNYPRESYVWYMYGIFLSQYQSKLSEAINYLKKADEISNNYIFSKKMGDIQLRMKNYHAAIRNYKTAMEKAMLERNKIEMLYLIGNAEYSYAKYLRQLIKKRNKNASTEERNKAYKNVIYYFTEYLNKQTSIYDGKKIKIYRLLSESYFGIKDIENAVKYINLAIDLSEGEETHIEYKKFISGGKIV